MPGRPDFLGSPSPGSYHSSAWFFELVDLARKLVLTGLLVFVDPGGISQLVVGLLVCLSMAFYSQHMRPFVDNAVDQANFHANVLLFVVLFAGLLLQNNAETQGDADEAVSALSLQYHHGACGTVCVDVTGSGQHHCPENVTRRRA